MLALSIFGLALSRNHRWIDQRQGDFPILKTSFGELNQKEDI
jgi:hypothetical protein